MAKAQIHIGTSGWSYQNWKHMFYPQGVKASEQLHFYAQHFDTVEINSSFYRLPSEQTIHNWSSQVPSDFIFAVKASRFITHTKRLKEGEMTTQQLFERIRALGKQLGPILFQLPGNFKKDTHRLEFFLSQLTQEFNYTFEFRDPSWFNDEIYALLKRYRIALCITDLKGTLSPQEITSHFTYIRLHGPKFAYRGSYASKLQEWQQKILLWSEKEIAVYCYFDNTDAEGHAVKDARSLKHICHLR